MCCYPFYRGAVVKEHFTSLLDTIDLGACEMFGDNVLPRDEDKQPRCFLLQRNNQANIPSTD